MSEYADYDALLPPDQRKIVLNQNQREVHGLLEAEIRKRLEASNLTFEIGFLKEVNFLATKSIRLDAGQFREYPVRVADSPLIPPQGFYIEKHVDTLAEYVNVQVRQFPKKNFIPASRIVHIAAMILWFLCWIHPFGDGNGRTARAMSYLYLNLLVGKNLAGKKPFPYQLAVNRDRYFDVLRQTDQKNEQFLNPLRTIDLNLINIVLIEELVHDAFTAQLTGIDS